MVGIEYLLSMAWSASCRTVHVVGHVGGVYETVCRAHSPDRTHASHRVDGLFKSKTRPVRHPLAINRPRCVGRDDRESRSPARQSPWIFSSGSGRGQVYRSNRVGCVLDKGQNNDHDRHHPSTNDGFWHCWHCCRTLGLLLLRRLKFAGQNLVFHVNP
jgi:hypothetical protein